jgi:hypothetical protein
MIIHNNANFFQKGKGIKCCGEEIEERNAANVNTFIYHETFLTNNYLLFWIGQSRTNQQIKKRTGWLTDSPLIHPNEITSVNSSSGP